MRHRLARLLVSGSDRTGTRTLGRQGHQATVEAEHRYRPRARRPAGGDMCSTQHILDMSNVGMR